MPGSAAHDGPDGALEPARSTALVMSWLRRGQPLTLLMDLLDGPRVPSREILLAEGRRDKIDRPDDASLARLLSWSTATRR